MNVDRTTVAAAFPQRLRTYHFLIALWALHINNIPTTPWGDGEWTALAGKPTTEKEFAKALRVQFTPTLLMLDEKGGTALRLNGYIPPHQFHAALDYAAALDADQILVIAGVLTCLLYTSPSPRDRTRSRMPSSA